MFVGFLRKGVHLERPRVKILTHGDSYDTGLHLRKELCADCRAEVSVEIALGLKVALGESRVLCGSCVQTFMKDLGRQATRGAKQVRVFGQAPFVSGTHLF